MRVQIIGRTSTNVPNDWAVLDEDDFPVDDINSYLRYLWSVEKPPNSIRAAAYDLRWYFEFLALADHHIDDVSDELLASFARWMRAPGDNVVAISEAVTVRSRTSTNRALSTVAGFYRYRGSLGSRAPGARGLRTLEKSATEYKRPRVTVIDNVGRAYAQQSGRRLGPRLPRPRGPRLKILTVQQVHELLEACDTKREQLILMLAFAVGLRMGQILGLRHEDIDTRGRVLIVQPRYDNPNGARAKSNKASELPISKQVNRLYIDYLHDEYGYVDSPFVFIDFSTLHPLTASSVNALVQKLTRRTGIEGWSLHTLRHTFVTLSRRAGVPLDVISSLVTHASMVTTADMYSHLDVEDLRRILVAHGAWVES